MQPARKKYTKRTVDNRSVQQELLNYNSWDELPTSYRDIIYGACGQCRGTKRISHRYVAHLLASLSSLNVDTIAATINRKRRALDEEPYTLRMVQYYAAILRCASQGLSHQLWKQQQQRIETTPTNDPSLEQEVLQAA